MKNTKQALLLSAYALLENVTPLKYDCGSLCGGACCLDKAVSSYGGGGMLLLPYEDTLIGKDKHFTVEQTCDGKILICDGGCDRGSRPFMCRIFPYYAQIDADGRISLKTDPRSVNVCPLALKKKGTRHSAVFHRNAVRAVRLLMRDEDFRRELTKTSDFCGELYKLYRKMSHVG